MEIKPTYVTFKQAVALKEKGFNEPCIAFYDEEDINCEINYYCNANHNVTGGISCWYDDLLLVTNYELDELGAFCFKNEEETESYKRVTAPEEWMVVEWFEQFNLYINITTEFYKEGVNFIWQVLEYDVASTRCIGKKSSMSYGDNGEYKTKEAAYSAAIDYILNNLL